MEINTDTHPLSEIEYQYLWDAIPESEWTTNVVYWRAVCSVVASIADGRATGARLPIAAIVNVWGNAGLASEKAMEQIAAVLGKPF